MNHKDNAPIQCLKPINPRNQAHRYMYYLLSHMQKYRFSHDMAYIVLQFSSLAWSKKKLNTAFIMFVPPLVNNKHTGVSMVMLPWQPISISRPSLAPSPLVCSMTNFIVCRNIQLERKCIHNQKQLSNTHNTCTILFTEIRILGAKNLECLLTLKLIL